MGGKSSSSTQANQSTSNSYADKRIVNESGLVATEGAAISSTNNSTWNVTDAGSIKAALDFASNADATNGVSFSGLLDAGTRNYGALLDSSTGTFDKLLGFADTVFKTGSDQVLNGQNAVMTTVQSLKNDERGAIDQKTIIVLALAAAGALVMMNRKG